MYIPRGLAGTRGFSYLRFPDGRSANFDTIAISSNLYPYKSLVQACMADVHVYSAWVLRITVCAVPLTMCPTFDWQSLAWPCPMPWATRRYQEQAAIHIGIPERCCRPRYLAAAHKNGMEPTDGKQAEDTGMRSVRLGFAVSIVLSNVSRLC